MQRDLTGSLQAAQDRLHEPHIIFSRGLQSARRPGRVVLVLGVNGPVRPVPDCVIHFETCLPGVARSPHAVRLENLFLHQLLERFAGEFLKDDLKKDHPLARVTVTLTRLEVYAQFIVRLDPAPVGKAGGVAETNAGGYSRVPRFVAQVAQILVPRIALILPERLVQIILERRVQVDDALLDEPHHQDGEDGFAEGGSVDFGIGPEWLTGREVDVSHRHSSGKPRPTHAPTQATPTSATLNSENDPNRQE